MGLEDFFDDDYVAHDVKNWDEIMVKYAKDIIAFYDKNDTIEKYFMTLKRDKLLNLDTERFREYCFHDWDMDPNDMEIELEWMNRSSNFFLDFVQSVSTMAIESGHSLYMIGVKEKKTDTYLALIRLCLPVLAVKPRHDYFQGKVYDGFVLNKHIVSGSIIVPTQPAGFNILGGKLASLVCTCHEVREAIIDFHDNKEPCFFETTSLYGNLTSASQYDGLEPFIRSNGMTDSNVLMFLPDDMFENFKTDMIEFYGKETYDSFKCGSFKTNARPKEYALLLKRLAIELERIDPQLSEDLKLSRKTKMVAHTQKRYYYSTYGYTNVKEYMDGDAPALLKGPNFDKHYLSYIVQWWKKKAHNRWSKLKEDGRLKTEIELYDLAKVDDPDTIKNIVR